MKFLRLSSSGGKLWNGPPHSGLALGEYQRRALGVHTNQSLCYTDPASSLTLRSIYYGFFPNKVVRTDERCYLNIICNSESKCMWSQSPSVGTAQPRAWCFVVVHWVAFRSTRWKGYKDLTATNMNTDLLTAVYILKILCIVLVGIPLL